MRRLNIAFKVDEAASQTNRCPGGLLHFSDSPLIFLASGWHVTQRPCSAPFGKIAAGGIQPYMAAPSTTLHGRLYLLRLRRRCNAVQQD